MPSRTQITVMRNRGLTEYEMVDTDLVLMKTSRDCSACGSRMSKGSEVTVAMFVSMRSGFHTRKKRYCKEACVPHYFYGGDKPKFIAPL